MKIVDREVVVQRLLQVAQEGSQAGLPVGWRGAEVVGIQGWLLPEQMKAFSP